MKYLLSIYLFSAFLFVGCGTSKTVSSPTLLNDNVFLLTETTTDASYGWKEDNPIKVGGALDSEGPLNEQRFLNALAGPEGQPISYRRVGNCCPFKTKNGILGSGLLDKYELSWKGQKETLIIYINMYDKGELKSPVGLTIIPEENHKARK